MGLVLKLQQKLKTLESEKDRLHRRLEGHDNSPGEHKAQDSFKVSPQYTVRVMYLYQGQSESKERSCSTARADPIPIRSHIYLIATPLGLFWAEYCCRTNMRHSCTTFLVSCAT